MCVCVLLLCIGSYICMGSYCPLGTLGFICDSCISHTPAKILSVETHACVCACADLVRLDLIL